MRITNEELPIILYICSKFNDFMKFFKQYIGILFIIIGTMVLIATRFSTLSTHNWLLLSGLFLIVAGIWLHIRSIKHESNY